MNVIRHYNKFTQMNEWKMFWDPGPTLLRIPSYRRQIHDPLTGNTAKIIPFIRRTNGNKIKSIAAVICKVQTC